MRIDVLIRAMEQHGVQDLRFFFDAENIFHLGLTLEMGKTSLDAEKALWKPCPCRFATLNLDHRRNTGRNNPHRPCAIPAPLLSGLVGEECINANNKRRDAEPA
jgi:hypothetical protein